LLRGSEALLEAEHAYRYLWARTDPAPPTLDYDWVRAWWDLHRDEGTPFLVQLEENGIPIALAPLYIRRRELSRRGALRTVCFLGTGEESADEVYGTNNSWLGAPEHHAALSDAVAEALRLRRGAWDRLWLSNVGPGTALIDDVAAGLDGQLIAAERTRQSNWVVDLPDSLSTFLDGVSAKHRSNMRRLLRRMESEGVTHEWITDADEAIEAYEQLAELHTRSWNARGQAGACASEIFSSFQRTMIRTYARQGRLWLQRLRLADETIAVYLEIEAGRQIYSYVGGVDPDFKRFSQRALTVLKVIERAASEGFECVDLLAGDYGYKHRYATRELPVTTWEAFGRTPAARAWIGLKSLRARIS
jgi:CelD/BcsL family acetyltransferase involved in cellulose biosynthesis